MSGNYKSSYSVSFFPICPISSLSSPLSLPTSLYQESITLPFPESASPHSFSLPSCSFLLSQQCFNFYFPLLYLCHSPVHLLDCALQILLQFNFWYFLIVSDTFLYGSLGSISSICLSLCLHNIEPILNMGTWLPILLEIIEDVGF